MDILTSSIYSRLYDLNLPSAKPSKKSICIVKKNQRLCFIDNNINEIDCKKNGDLCVINIRSFENNLTNKLPESVFTNVTFNDDYFTTEYQYLGIIEKEKLKEIIPLLNSNFSYKESDNLNVSLGKPNPSKFCAFKFWDKNCRMYIDSDHWKMSLRSSFPYVGFERNE